MIPNIPGSHHLVVPKADELARVPRQDLLRWCHTNARYLLVTQELVAWLKPLVAGKRAIEVGAGMGDLGFALGVPMTDSGVQTSLEMRLLYAAQGQTTTEPPEDVERLDAVTACKKYRPEVVVASWLTQKYQPGDTHAFTYGADESAILRRCQMYVFIGNESVHSTKRIMSLPHQTFAFPWLWSRSNHRELDRIWVWTQNRSGLSVGPSPSEAQPQRSPEPSVSASPVEEP